MIRLKYISIYAFALLCSLLPAMQTAAQKRPRVAEPDTTALFRGLSLSVDLFGAAQRQLSDYGQYEAALHVNLKDRYFPVLEMGVGDSDHEDDAVTGLSTKARAPYGRIGCDFNVMKNKHDDYRIYIGLRYAFTSFKFDVSHPGVTDPVWGGEATYQVTDEKCSCHWAEGVFAVDAKIYGPVRLGWSVRYRRRIAMSDVSTGDVWYVPGYGRSGKSRLGGTFNLTFEL